MSKHGNPFGSHRVIEPAGVLPQGAARIDNNMEEIFDNEILVDVDTLNIDSASFAQIKEQSGGDDEKIKQTILDIVAAQGKLRNPVTGSGGMFMGRVARIGTRIGQAPAGRQGLEVGDRIASLVSLSLTPLRIDAITELRKEIDQVAIRGQAILFESGLYTKLPPDMSPSLALAVLDVCGAPAQTARLVKPGDTVVIIGATGKSGILCAYEARKRAGICGRVIGIGHSEHKIERLKALGLCDELLRLDATDALACYSRIHRLTQGALADLVINTVNIPDTEMATILLCRDRGLAYFFSMSTSFTKAALGAEGVGKDIDMIIGNGYSKDHAEIALQILRESEPVRRLFEGLYA